MTAEIILTDGSICLIDADDLALVAGRKWCNVRGYAMSTGRGGTYMHRLILDPGQGLEVDHINRDPLDNRRANLRPATPAQNRQNRSYSRSVPGYRGVKVRENGRFYVSIMADGVTHSEGGFKTLIEAAVAYDILAKEHHGEFASLNFSPARDWILPQPRLRARKTANDRLREALSEIDWAPSERERLG